MTSKAIVFDFGVTVPVFCYLNHRYDSSLSTGSVLARASYNSQTKLLLLVELLENLSDDEESA